MSSHIQKSCVGLEATLSDSKKKYGDKVNALLSAWEHVTNFIPAATPEATQSLIEWVHKHTLKLVLRGEWPKLSPATKTHLGVTLQRCSTHLARHPAAPRCATLIALVHDPWTRPALDSILNGTPDPALEEEFCCSEKGELLTMRLRILCEDRCEDIAVNLAAACVRSLRRSDQLRSVCEAQHVQYIIDVYIVLLFKLKRTQDIFAQLKLMDLGEGLELVQRLGGDTLNKYGTARVWKNSTRAAELVAQYLVTAGMVRPVEETGSSTLEEIINSWACLHSKLKDMTPTLPGMIRKLIEPAESAQHIYIFCAVLSKHFGGSIKPLMIELYIRALTTDMNELESQKVKSDKEKVRETAKRLSSQFLKLADVVVENVGIARECILTAFSLHPTRACFDRISEMAIACGKVKRDGDSVDDNNRPHFFNTGQEEQTTLVCRPSSEVSTSETTELNEIPEARESSALKSLATSPRLIEPQSSDRCLLHTRRDPASNGPLGELCFNCGEFTGIEIFRVKSPEVTKNVERTLDALILIKGDAVTGSANYDEKSAPNQVLDAEKLGVSPQLCDDLAVVLSSPRYHMLSWVLDWKELNSLCEKYLENAEEMRNTNKELKYLNIDYSQFKDWPLEEDTTKDVFFGIEKGYEQWADVQSDDSEEFGSFQPAGPYKRSLTRRSLEDTTDSDSGSVMRIRRPGKPKKIHRLASTDSDYEEDPVSSKSTHFHGVNGNVDRSVMINDDDTETDTDTNTQDSQTDSLGSDGCRQDKKPKKKSPAMKDVGSKGRGKSKLTVESMSRFHMLVTDNVRCSAEDVSSSDISSNDIITLFSADMDESKCETIKGSAYNTETPLIITEKRSDPAVLKSLRMFRPHNVRKPTRISQILQKNVLNKNKDSSPSNNNTGLSKFSPMLGAMNLNPKIILTRSDEVKKKIITPSKKLSPGDITSELLNLQKSMPFCPNKNTTIVINEKTAGCEEKLESVGRDLKVVRSLNCSKRGGASLQRKTKYDILAKAVRDSDILAKNVPGLNSLDMMVPPRVQPTVNIVQLSRNIPQSPNSGPVNSGGTPPRNRSSSIAGGGIQLPGTPTSTGHDSGVGMSPADRTPPPRSLLQDIGEEANQPPDTPPPANSMSSNIEPASPRSTENIQESRCISPNKSPSPSIPSPPVTSVVTVTSEQLQILCKPDGTYRLASVNPTSLSLSSSSSSSSISSQSSMSCQRGMLTLQTSDENNFSRTQQIQRGLEVSGESNRTIYDGMNAVNVKTVHQTNRNTPPGLPKFQQAFGKPIYTLTGDTTTVAESVTTDTMSQLTAVPKATNLSKAVQTSVQNTQANAGVSVQSITNIPTLQLSTSARQILNIVQTSEGGSVSGSAVPTTPTNMNNPTLAQLVQTSSSPGVIYTHKIPVTISTTNPSQLNIIPHTLSRAGAAVPGNRAPVVKLNIIRAGTPLRQQNISGAIQAVLAAPRVQQNVRHDNLLSTPIDVPTNQVSSTTLEQLREFESVLEQVKERSTVQPHHQSPGAATTTVQTQTQTQAQTQSQTQAQTIVQQSQQTAKHHMATNALAQQLQVMSSRAAATNNEFSSVSNTVTFQQEVYPQQKVSLAYVDQTTTVTQKVVSASTPVVVVTSYCQPAASPALSVTSQSSSSPCVTPAPAPLPSTGITPPSSAKPGCKKSAPKAVKTSATNTSKAPPVPKPQQKPQEDEQTAQRIYAILDEYAEQLRNSPDLNNKPAPRRRSNPPTNPSQSSKRKKSGSSKSKTPGQQGSELSPGTDDLGRTMGSEDSSSGVVHVQDSPASISVTDDGQTTSGMENTPIDIRNLTNDSNDAVELNVKRRNLIFTEQTNTVGQPRAVIVQEAVQTAAVSVSEALASVTGKIGSTAVLVPGTNYILPVNLMKGAQQFTIVSGGSKLLATVPTTVRAGSTGSVSNALVLQSFLNQAGKIIAQPTQMKQVKVPTLHTINTGQSSTQHQQHHQQQQPQQHHHQQQHLHHTVQNPAVVISQTSTGTQFTNEPVESNNCDSNAKVDTPTSVGMTPQETSGSTIIVNKTPTIGLLQRNINDFTENQQFCGVIASSPSLTLQSTRLFNSSIAKLTAPAVLKTENVVCLTPATMTQSSEKKCNQDGSGVGVGSGSSAHAENPIAIQTATIALAFTPQSEVLAGNAVRKETKDNTGSSTRGGNDGIVSPKSVKRKFDDESVSEILPKVTNSIVGSTVSNTLQNTPKLENATLGVIGTPTKVASDQFLVNNVAGGTDVPESTARRSTENVVDSVSRVGNGLLCGNARLQEAWEPERKTSSPDTPWRYVPASSNQLGLEPLKVYSSREGENPGGAGNGGSGGGGGVHSVVHIINKGQGIEMASGQLFQTTTPTTATTKKYFMNHTLEPFQQYSNRSQIKTQLNPRLDRELLQQRMERKAAAIERELRLQKSLSEECEDLGVDEPSTSDLFPEADLLFDTNHSPSFDQSSQDATCSQPLGLKSYNSSSYFRHLDSSSSSRDVSPITDFKAIERRKNPAQRTRTIKDTAKRAKRERNDDSLIKNPSKQSRLDMQGADLSQDDTSNSNSDGSSRLSPSNLMSGIGNEARKDCDTGLQHGKMNSLVTSSSTSSTSDLLPSSVMKLQDTDDLDSMAMNANNMSAVSSGDESLTLLGDGTADVTMPSPLSPTTGTLLTTHKYTYANKKRSVCKTARKDYLSWESPVSDQARTSSEDEEASSIGESISSQPEESMVVNGLEENISLPSTGTKSPNDYCSSYLNKHRRNKLKVNARVVLNRNEVKAGGGGIGSGVGMLVKRTKNDSIGETGAVSSDKTSEPSDDEGNHHTAHLVGPDCRARRSSLRGHVKKGCACCNGSPERPKKKSVKLEQKLKKRLASKQFIRKR